MEITFFQGLWFLLIFVLIAGYFVLDGFDLGAGVLYPFVAKNDRDKAIVRRSIGPVWDGNEVWLLTAGGALFAAFPAAYATTFSGFYLAVASRWARFCRHCFWAWPWATSTRAFPWTPTAITRAFRCWA